MKRFGLLILMLMMSFQLNPLQPSPVSAQARIVVSNVSQLLAAIQNVPDGGVIVVNGGTYASPTGGFNFSNINKRITVQAAPGATVLFDGGGAREIVLMKNNNYSSKEITFDGIVFQNGLSVNGHTAGGASIWRGRAVFMNSKFIGNRNSNYDAGGAGAVVNLGSTALFINCEWNGNSARNFGAGLVVEGASKVYIHNSKFLNNRTNLPNHNPYSAGAGLFVVDAHARVSNTLFQNNHAGYVGGAIYSLGNWQDPVSTPRTTVTVSNSTFIGNSATKDPSVSLAFPTEGGAVHSEDQVTTKIYFSRFYENSADNGGAVNLYRAIVEVEDSVFRGNRAVGTGPARGFGGAINLISNDTPLDGGINQRVGSVVLRRSLIQGRYSSVTTVGQSSGGIAASGDTNRLYGANGTSKMGTADQNMAPVTIDSVAFVDLDVARTSGVDGSGNGGAAAFDLAKATITNSIVVLSSATSSISSEAYGSGGGFSIMDQSNVSINNTTFSRNSSTQLGGALFLQGSNLNMSNSKLLFNEVSPGVQEPRLLESLGAAIFSAPDVGRGLYVTGTIQSNLFSQNIGLPLWEDDYYEKNPINDLYYLSNSFYSSNNFGGNTISDIFCNSMTGKPYCGHTTSSLNSLTVEHIVKNTKKAPVANTGLSQPSVTGTIMAFPSSKLSRGAAGDVGSTPAYLVYAWGGASAKLDGSTVSGNAGIKENASAGSHTLGVSSTNYQANVGTISDPRVSFSTTGGVYYWTISGSYLDAGLNVELSLASGETGGVTIPAGVSPVYLYVQTKEGGIFAEVRDNSSLTKRFFLPLLNR